MIHMRPSVPEDVPRQRELWALAFGDGGEYLDNFYQTYYRPERVLVLEEEGAVRAMTAWFDTALAEPGRERWKAGYLYAVATHPDDRGRGLAGALLKYAAFYLREEQGCQAMTTVPAEPSLHRFFAQNGFRECFTHTRLTPAPAPAGAEPPFPLEPLSPEEYGRMREELLSGLLHIVYPADALAYQAGCCRLSGGGLYLARTAAGPVLLCAEGGEDGALLVKELLGCPEARALALPCLKTLLPGWSGAARVPGPGTQFGMLRWLYPGLEARWDWSAEGYLGLAFD